METEPTVFVVDDDPGMRQSLRWLLQSVSLAVETFESAEEFLASYSPARPGCLLLDVRMPGMSGLQLQDVLVKRDARLPIIIVTAYAEVPTAVRSLKTGAVDFIEKPFSDEALLDCVLKAIESDRETRREDAVRAAAAERLALLTSREREVMQGVVDGQANKVIATDLGIGEKTVEAHRAQVMKKLEVDSLAELIRLTVAASPPKGKP